MSKPTFLTRRTTHWTIAAVTVVAWACDDGAPEPIAGVDEDAATPVLRSIADNALAPTYAEFAVTADALSAAADDYVLAIEAGEGVEPARAALDEAYLRAALSWQRAEVMQLGPAAGSEAVGGESLRHAIYSWPLVNPCRVDQELVSQGYSASDFFEAQLVNAYGFDALEYLLFVDGQDNACAPQLEINNDGSWAALSEEQLLLRRAEYAAVVSAGIASTAGTLAEAWAAGGEWNAALANAGSGPYGSVQAGVDEVLRAMFYVDKVLKDAKIAGPAGILGCSADICLDSIEAPYGRHSAASAVANLEGFARLYHGGSDAAVHTGFDDMLREAGEAALADEISADIDNAIEALQAIDGSFAEALTADAAALDEAHAAIVALTDDLKRDLPTILRLNIPAEAAGDAD